MNPQDPKMPKNKTPQSNPKPQPTAPLETLHVQIHDLQDKLARSLADYANLEKRIEAQRQMLITLATASMLNKILPVLDDLNLAQQHLSDSGLQITIDKLKQVLKSEGIEEINPLNQPYDEITMSCIGTQEGPANQVLIVHKIGYKLHDEILRPAEVVVGKIN